MRGYRLLLSQHFINASGCFVIYVKISVRPDRKFNRTGLGSFWPDPEPDNKPEKVNRIRPDWLIERIGRIFLIFSHRIAISIDIGLLRTETYLSYKVGFIRKY